MPSGYPTAPGAILYAALLVESQRDYAVDLCGPTRVAQAWQTRAAEGFAAQEFQID